MAEYQDGERLYLLFRLEGDRYALEAAEVIEVRPLCLLKQLPGLPAWIAGVVSYRQQAVPVLDLAARTGRPAARQQATTRLVMVHYHGQAGQAQPAAVLGLILEQVTDTLRCAPQAFQEYGLDNREAPYLGPVLHYRDSLIQRISIRHLLPDEIHARLWPLVAEG